MNLDEEIKLVKKDLTTRFKGCSHTVFILLWDDNTRSVECRYGEGDKIYISRYYNNKLEYIVEDVNKKNDMMIDEVGNKYYLRKNLTN